MTNEEIEKTMLFIIKQQESFASEILQVTFDLKDLLQAHASAEKRISGLESAVVAGITLVNDLTQKVTALAEQQARTDAQLAETDERLNAFITTVERYISEDRNGKP